MAMVLDAFVDRFRTCPKANNERMTLETAQVTLSGGQPSSRGDDRPRSMGYFLHDPRLPLPEGRFAVLREDILNWLSSPGLDDMIRVQKSEMQAIGHDPPDAGLPRAHETDQGEVADGSGLDHATSFEDLLGFGTRKVASG